MAVLPCPDAAVALQGRYLQQFLDVVHQLGAKQVSSLDSVHLLLLESSERSSHLHKHERQLQQVAKHVHNVRELADKQVYSIACGLLSHPETHLLQ